MLDGQLSMQDRNTLSSMLLSRDPTQNLEISLFFTGFLSKQVLLYIYE